MKSVYGDTHNVQDSEGSRGTVTFQNNYLVAAFKNDETDPRKFPSMDFFQGAPDKIIEIAETKTLQYLLESINGEGIPLISTAIWGIENQIFSFDTFDIMIENGGRLRSRHLQVD